MSAPPQTPKWLYSASLGAYYYVDTQRNELVLQDRRRMPQPGQPNQAQPRSQPPIATTPSSSISLTQYPDTASSTKYESGPGESSSLDQRLGNLTLGTQQSQAAQTQQRAESSSYPSEDIAQATDQTTGVTTRVNRGQTPGFAFPDAQRQAVNVPIHRSLLSSPGQEERLDPNFRLRDSPKRFFVPGRVFLILWTEPGGESLVSANQGQPLDLSQGKYSQWVHSKVRRFVVIRGGEQSCSALPIATYSGRATRHKPRNEQAEHSIIYTGKTEPQPFPDEVYLLPAAIRVDPDERDEKLHLTSRINYGKVYTIEHDLKVKPFGMVNRDSAQSLYSQFQEVWVEKVGVRRPTAPARANVQGTNQAAASALPQAGFSPAQAEAMRTHGSVAADRETHRRREAQRQGSTQDAASIRSGDTGGKGQFQSSPATQISEDQARAYFNSVYQQLLDKSVPREAAEAQARKSMYDLIQTQRTGENTRPSASRDAMTSTRGGSAFAEQSRTESSTRPRRPSAQQRQQVNQSQSSRSAGIQANAVLSRSEGHIPDSIDVLMKRGWDAGQAQYIQGLVTKENFTPRSAEIVASLYYRGQPLDVAKKIGAMVDAGWEKDEALAHVSKQQPGSLSRSGKGKERAP